MDETPDSRPVAPEKRAPLRRGIFLLPNILTTCCLGSGFFAIVSAINGDFSRAGAAVFVAMLFDGLDGRVARWTGTESQFGKEFDSLADMVAFGLAPALLAYQWGAARLTEYGQQWGRFGWLASFFYALCAALRLARFNTRSGGADKRFFEGLPSPSAAALVAAFVWFSHEWRAPGLTGLAVAFGITAIAGALMVSGFPYPSLKQVDWDRRIKLAYAVIVPTFLILIAAEPPTMLLAMFASFAASAPALSLWRRLRRRPLREAAKAG
jgi:CDP-diacylglycerol---serine O-phosphatidyltransferase